MRKELIIKQTQTWLSSFIIKHNICPFAKRHHEHGSIHYSVVESILIKQCLQSVFEQCLKLTKQTEIATTLIIYPNNFSDFSDYLDFLTLAESLLDKQNFQGIYQLASFHPHYQFADENEFDPANYTNRSPYPMLHIIREAILENELKSYPKPESIPERNIKLTRQMGLANLQAILTNCIAIDK